MTARPNTMEMSNSGDGPCLSAPAARDGPRTLASPPRRGVRPGVATRGIGGEFGEDRPWWTLRTRGRRTRGRSAGGCVRSATGVVSRCGWLPSWPGSLESHLSAWSVENVPWTDDRGSRRSLRPFRSRHRRSPGSLTRRRMGARLRVVFVGWHSGPGRVQTLVVVGGHVLLGEMKDAAPAGAAHARP